MRPLAVGASREGLRFLCVFWCFGKLFCGILVGFVLSNGPPYETAGRGRQPGGFAVFVCFLVFRQTVLWHFGRFRVEQRSSL